MNERRCPTCDRTFDPEQSTTLPFCSVRCRLADLNRWLDEGYSLPYERPEEDDEVAEERVKQYRGEQND
jgi:endogenous inhibitor of DNA gyrase (YacG/DUF329 family)